MNALLFYTQAHRRERYTGMPIRGPKTNSLSSQSTESDTSATAGQEDYKRNAIYLMGEQPSGNQQTGHSDREDSFFDTIPSRPAPCTVFLAQSFMLVSTDSDDVPLVQYFSVPSAASHHS
ncbi:hypothetical protein PUNSTDRAFT_131815 [Punctularia strigosozonata HHB-11173 SS5]|uniref:uncharacterized protein n=1 Tax=Punctularia strigosozonata (strain HHB-11173) TaxID=741275 RepID=UPI0004416FE8|nr:uncharacterized protein PUNSTDRAFT_131815 [Punctularia strigosozonata HHB-11173 SS5]EIN11656.1 hypothetical protein PUNSTDRAFT_131815 [Punctularia strigosozonata HHB-11173 SS5]